MSEGINNMTEHNNTPRSRIKDILQQPVTRRNVVKSATAIATTYGIASYINNDILDRPGLIRQAVEHILKTEENEPAVQEQEIVQIEPIPTSENQTIKDIEQRLGIRLVSLREAYQLMGTPFNEHNKDDLANLLPMRWDAERATMVEKYYNFLPKFFHEPDGQGQPLTLTLTNFAPSMKHGSYLLGADVNLLQLDYERFAPEDEQAAFELLTHESIHYMQELGYSRITQKIKEIFGKEPKEVFNDTIQIINSLPKAIDDDELHVRSLMMYGVSKFGLTPEDFQLGEARDEIYDFEANLGAIYISGETFFKDQLKKIYGNKAIDLYEYMRDTIFGGKEYDVSPLRKEEQRREQESIPPGAALFNIVTSGLINNSARGTLRIPTLDASDPYLKHLYQKHYFSYNKLESDAEENGNTAIKSTVSFKEQEDEPAIDIVQETDLDGNIAYQRIGLWIDKEEERMRYNTNESIHEKGTLQRVARKLFSLPDTQFTWTIDDNKRYGRIEKGVGVKHGKKHSLTMREFGDISYEISSQPIVDTPLQKK